MHPDRLMNNDLKYSSVVRVRVNRHFTNILFDSGANQSAINYVYAKQIKAKVLPLDTGDAPFLIGASGDKIKIWGKTILTLHVGNEQLQYPFLLVKGLTAAVICGFNFMQTHKVDLNVSQGMVCFGGKTSVPFVLRQNYLGVARLAKGVRVRPGKEIALAVSIPKGTNGEKVQFLPFPVPLAHIDVLPDNFCEVNPQVCVRVQNMSRRAIRLRKHAALANCIRVLSDSPPLVYPVEDISPQPAPSNVLESVTTVADIHAEPLSDPTAVSKALKEEILRKNPKDRSIAEVGLSIDEGKLFTDAEKQPFLDVLQENIDMFALSNAELPGCTITEAVFELKDPNSKPVRGKVFNHSKEAREEIERQVTEMLKNGTIERSRSPWSSSCMLVKKSDGSQRMVQDYRPINALLKEEYFSPNTLAEIVERVGATQPTIFSSIDLRSAYNQIRVQKGASRDYCAFVCHLGTFSSRVMPFGLCSCPANFMMMITEVIGHDDLLQQYCIPYLDDLLLFSRTLEEHTDLLRRLFDALRWAGLRAHPQKCEFLKAKVKYVGHIFSKDGVTACPKKLSAILDFPRPKTKRNLKSFLGMVAFFRQYQDGLDSYNSTLVTLVEKRF